MWVDELQLEPAEEQLLREARRFPFLLPGGLGDVAGLLLGDGSSVQSPTPLDPGNADRPAGSTHVSLVHIASYPGDEDTIRS